MKKLWILVFLLPGVWGMAQSDKIAVEQACMKYLEGFYEGDSAKLSSCLLPSLNKLGYFKKGAQVEYEPQGYMTYEQALAFAVRVKENKRFAPSDAPKEVNILDVSHKIASAKVTAWWGIDYMLLSKQTDGKWMIEQVLWEGSSAR
jgi:hypothetical protein